MAAAEELLELKFRLSDGTDIGPSTYPPATSVASLKERILAEWPPGASMHAYIHIKYIYT